MKRKEKNPQLIGDNYRGDDGRIRLVRCYKCGGRYGKENYLPAVMSGICAWCGDDANLYDDLKEIVSGKSKFKKT